MKYFTYYAHRNDCQGVLRENEVTYSTLDRYYANMSSCSSNYINSGAVDSTYVYGNTRISEYLTRTDFDQFQFVYYP